jgi:hypothetical protein
MCLSSSDGSAQRQAGELTQMALDDRRIDLLERRYRGVMESLTSRQRQAAVRGFPNERVAELVEIALLTHQTAADDFFKTVEQHGGLERKHRRQHPWMERVADDRARAADLRPWR